MTPGHLVVNMDVSEEVRFHDLFGDPIKDPEKDDIPGNDNVDNLFSH